MAQSSSWMKRSARGWRVECDEVGELGHRPNRVERPEGGWRTSIGSAPSASGRIALVVNALHIVAAVLIAGANRHGAASSQALGRRQSGRCDPIVPPSNSRSCAARKARAAWKHAARRGRHAESGAAASPQSSSSTWRLSRTDAASKTCGQIEHVRGLIHDGIRIASGPRTAMIAPTGGSALRPADR